MKRIWMSTALSAVLGAAGGWLYYHHVGCSNGTCAITSNPWGSAIYGAVAGSMLIGLFTPVRRTSGAQGTQQRNNENQR